MVQNRHDLRLINLNMIKIMSQNDTIMTLIMGNSLLTG